MRSFDDLPYKLVEDYLNMTVEQIYASKTKTKPNQVVEMIFSYDEDLYCIDSSYAKTPIKLAIQDIIYGCRKILLTDVSKIKVYFCEPGKVYLPNDIEGFQPRNQELFRSSIIMDQVKEHHHLQVLQRLPYPIATTLSELQPIILKAYPIEKLATMHPAVLDFFKSQANIDPLLSQLNKMVSSTTLSSQFFTSTEKEDKVNVNYPSFC